MIGAELMLALINTSFYLILNIHMRNLGFEDEYIASCVSWRFLGVLLFALPFGLWIKGRRFKPWMLLAAIGVPLVSLGILSVMEQGQSFLLESLFFLWGAMFMFGHVVPLPFIMRNSGNEVPTEAISLNYATFSMGAILASLLITGLSWLGIKAGWGESLDWDEGMILRVLVLLGFGAVPLVLLIKEAPPDEGVRLQGNNFLKGIREYDWKLIAEALLPTSIIAVGAGLTIPFINLYFNSVFGMSAEIFSRWGGVAFVLVMLGALGVPAVRRKFGYRVGITVSQSLAVLMLVIMSVAEVISGPGWVVWLAISAYLFRQPFMNMAAPLTSELALRFVGKRNQELISALVSSIWNGSFVLSARIFEVMRGRDIPYWKIFLITSGLYVIGIILYYRLIVVFEKREK